MTKITRIPILTKRSTSIYTPLLISIQNTTFYTQHPSIPTSIPNPPLFPNLSLTLSRHVPWAVLAPSPVKTKFLEVLRGGYIPDPAVGRTYPWFTRHRKSPTSQAGVVYVGFGAKDSGSGAGGIGMLGGVDGGGYIGARYESLRETGDVTLEKWLISGGALNPYLEVPTTSAEGDASALPPNLDPKLFARVVGMMNLVSLLHYPVMTLSTGEARRAKLASALLHQPAVLLLDDPFMGLDPPSTTSLSKILSKISKPAKLMRGTSTTPVLGLRPQDPVPEWVEYIAVLGEEGGVLSIGRRKKVVREMKEMHGVDVTTGDPGVVGEGLFAKVWAGVGGGLSFNSGIKVSSPAPSTPPSPSTPSTPPTSKPLISLNNITLSYTLSPPRPRHLLKNFTWHIHPGSRWALFGANGSGKTTLLALLTSDHPQAYSQDVTIFGQRRGDPGVSVFDVQKRMGIAGQEVLAFWPRHLTLRRTVESAWADTPLMKPLLPEGAAEKVDEIIAFFKDAYGDVPGLNEVAFGELTLMQQRLTLFLRAAVKQPDVLILDEAFSGMDDAVREKCFTWMDPVEEGGMGGVRGDMAVVCVSHVQGEMWRGVREWVRLGGIKAGGGQGQGQGQGGWVMGSV